MDTTRITLRLPADLAAEAAYVAEQQGQSMNAFLVQATRNWTHYQSRKLGEYWATVKPRLPAGPARKSNPPPAALPKAGRNDPCPCGSGRKYKQCHGGPAMA